MEVEEAVAKVQEIAKRYEKQLELATEVAKIELERRRQKSDDRAPAAAIKPDGH